MENPVSDLLDGALLDPPPTVIEILAEAEARHAEAKKILDASREAVVEEFKIELVKLYNKYRLQLQVDDAGIGVEIVPVRGQDLTVQDFFG